MTPIIIKLRTNDGKLLKVDRKWLQPMATIWNMLKAESSDSNEVIPLPKIDSKRTLKLLIKWCSLTMHFPDEPEVNEGVYILRRLIRNDDQDLFKLTLAANYLELHSLLEACTQRLADIINRCENVEALRLRFNIPSEEECVEEAIITPESRLEIN